MYTVYTVIELNILSRASLSDAAAAAIRAMIVDGRLRAGERLNEVHLAARLGLSRTPLREALNRLASEGALEARPHLGYLVKPLTREEFEQIYDIRPILDPAALRLAGLPAPAQIERLEKLNRKLAKAADQETAIALDDAWHLGLLSACPNRVLIELIKSMILRTRRYELALARETTFVAQASDDHARILAALRAGDLSAACSALEHNMQSGKAPIIAWLRAREQKQHEGDKT
jgi:DNA-binding GntR family transcriptional regulator